LRRWNGAERRGSAIAGNHGRRRFGHAQADPHGLARPHREDAVGFGRTRVRNRDRHGLRFRRRQEHGEKIFVPVQDEREQDRGRKPRAGERQHDLPEDIKASGTVELGRFFEFDGQAGKEIVHQPDDDGKVGNGVDDDQRQMGIKQPHGLEHHVDRDDDDDGRQNALGNDPKQYDESIRSSKPS